MKQHTNLTASENQIKPKSLRNNVLVQELEKELLLYDLERDKAYCLNEISLMIWNLCDGENTVEDIRRQVSIQLKTPIPEEIVWLALNDLKNEKLLSNYREIRIKFNGLSRRDVIRKIGLATMIVLPLISAITAPKAALAQSLAVCSPSFCICADPTCIQFGELAVLQDACVAANCSGSGGSNCLCVGRFFCDQEDGIRFGMCGLV